MPKFDENLKCHFFENDCVYPIPEKTLKELLEESEEDDLITMIPSMDEPICTNCLLATIIEIINLKLI